MAPSPRLPTRARFLENMQTTTLADLPDKVTDLTCNICFDPLVDAIKGKAKKDTCAGAVLLHDTHVFGEACVRKWLKNDDWCPMCRQKVHSARYGADMAGDLVEEAEELAQRVHSLENPVDDRRALTLLLTLSNNLNELYPHTLVGEHIETALNNLDMARMRWYFRDRDHFPVAPDSTYTPIGSTVDASQSDHIVLVQGYRMQPILWRVCDALCRQSLDNAASGASAHVATHPLARRAVHAISNQLLRNDMRSVPLQNLEDSLYEVIDAESCLRGVMDWNISRKELKSLTWFIRDMINTVLAQLLKWQRDGTYIVF